MNNLVIIVGALAFIVGTILSIYRIRVYPDRESGKRGGIFLPGVETGSFIDRMWYIGSSLGFGLMGLVWIISELTKKP